MIEEIYKKSNKQRENANRKKNMDKIQMKVLIFEIF